MAGGGTFSEIDVADELHHDLGRLHMQCNVTMMGCAEAGIGSAAAVVYLCGLRELVSVRRITHRGWIMTGKRGRADGA